MSLPSEVLARARDAVAAGEADSVSAYVAPALTARQSTAQALARLDEDAHPVLDVLLGLPVTVADDLDARRAREIGRLLRGRDARIDLAHAALCSRHRTWPLVTGEPEAHAALGVPLEIEPLP